MLPDFVPVPRKYRHDGWTPERQKRFIEALCDSGSVQAAAAAVNMSAEGAYQLRRQPGAEQFAAAWLAALDRGIERLEDIALARALNGVEVPVYSYGKLIGTRIIHNDRLLMFMLRNRADQRFAAGASGTRHNWLHEQERAAERDEQERAQHALGERVRQQMDQVRDRLRAANLEASAEEYEQFKLWKAERGLEETAGGEDFEAAMSLLRDAQLE